MKQKKKGRQLDNEEKQGKERERKREKALTVSKCSL